MKIILFFILLLTYGHGICQTNTGDKNNQSVSNCYKEEVYQEGEVFAKTEIPPVFNKGQTSAFPEFLIQRVNFIRGIDTLKNKEMVVTDTAYVKFIINKHSIMSNLFVSNLKNEQTRKELETAIKQSACLWQSGSFSGRNVKSWVVLKIYYSVIKDKNEISVKLGYDMLNKWEEKYILNF